MVAELGDIVKGLTKADQSRPKLGTAEEPIQIKLGDDDCPITFSHNLPEERYRYSVLVRLVEPRTSVLTETLRVPIFEGRRNFLDYALRNAAWLGIPGATHHFAERVSIDQPISVDGFRDRIVGNVGGVVSEETALMAALRPDIRGRWGGSDAGGSSLGDLHIPAAGRGEQRGSQCSRSGRL